jgi:hypothetical protein
LEETGSVRAFQADTRLFHLVERFRRKTGLGPRVEAALEGTHVPVPAVEEEACHTGR